MNDYLIKATAFNNQVRAYAAITTTTVDEARKRHSLMPIAATALGRTMTASVLLGSMLKGNNNLTVTVNGGGKTGPIIVDANTLGDVRGYIRNSNVYVPLNNNNQIDVGEAVGINGTLTVTRNNHDNVPFVGSVPLVSGEIGEDFTSYLLNSEQIPSSVGVSTIIDSNLTIKVSGGFIIQLMPGTDINVINEIESRIQKLPNLSKLLLSHKSLRDILSIILGEELKILEEMPIQFKCECSKERISNIIVSLGKEEIQDMIETDGQANAECHFCNEQYLFTIEDLKKLASNAH